MKNKILLIGTVGIMTIITVPAFSQTATTNSPVSVPKHPMYVPSQPSKSGKGQAIKPAPQSAHVPSTVQIAPKHSIYAPVKPTAGGKAQPMKTLTTAQIVHTPSTVQSVPKHPMYAPSPIKPKSASAAKATGTATTTNSTTNIH